MRRRMNRPFMRGQTGETGALCQEQIAQNPLPPGAPRGSGAGHGLNQPSESSGEAGSTASRDLSTPRKSGWRHRSARLRTQSWKVSSMADAFASCRGTGGGIACSRPNSTTGPISGLCAPAMSVGSSPSPPWAACGRISVPGTWFFLISFSTGPAREHRHLFGKGIVGQRGLWRSIQPEPSCDPAPRHREPRRARPQWRHLRQHGRPRLLHSRGVRDQSQARLRCGRHDRIFPRPSWLARRRLRSRRWRW